jgi:hypothetical protein
METHELPNTVLYIVMVGLILGVGVLILGYFQVAIQSSLKVVDEEQTCNNVTATYCTLTNVPLDPAATFSVRNKSITIPSSAYTIDKQNGRFALTNQVYNQSGNVKLNFTYNYLTDNTYSTQVGNVNTSLATIPSTWLPLIVVVMALAIILTLIIRSFNFGGAGKR